MIHQPFLEQCSYGQFKEHGTGYQECHGSGIPEQGTEKEREQYLISRPVCRRYVSDHKYCCHSFHLTYVQSSVIHLEDCYNSLILYYTHYTLLLPAFHSLAVYVLRHSNNNFLTYGQTLFLFLTVT